MNGLLDIQPREPWSWASLGRVPFFSNAINWWQRDNTASARCCNWPHWLFHFVMAAYRYAVFRFRNRHHSVVSREKRLKRGEWKRIAVAECYHWLGCEVFGPVFGYVGIFVVWWRKTAARSVGNAISQRKTNKRSDKLQNGNNEFSSRLRWARVRSCYSFAD